MAIARFHSFRGEKSALILVKENPFVFNSTAVYVPKEGIPADVWEMKDDEPTAIEGNSFEIPEGFKVVDFVDPETGEVRKANNGETLKVLAY